MGTMNYYEMSDADLQKFAAQAFQVGVAELANFGELPPEQAERFTTQYGIILVRKGFFGRAFERLFGNNDGAGDRLFVLVKLPDESKQTE